MEGELQDWEVLQSSGSTTEDSQSKSLEEIEDVTRGMVTFDYFSLENNNGLCRVETVDERSEDGSVQSGSPGWVEPRSDATFGPKHHSELWSDSSSDRVEDQRLAVDDDVIDELGLEKFGRNEVGIVEYVERRVETEGNIESIAREKGLVMDSDEGTERKDESSLSSELARGDDDDSLVGGGESVGGKEEKGFVWWKIPIELLKYCVFRVNPIWPFSMAAAVVGFVVLGRRLYNMKRKSRTLQLKVLLDDKVTNHGARWNEAISVVKRVPIIRPALPPTVGVNQWSMMGLR